MLPQTGTSAGRRDQLEAERVQAAERLSSALAGAPFAKAFFEAGLATLHTYVRLDEVRPEVRVIAIDGKLPTDAAYQLFVHRAGWPFASV